ncbi:cellulose binding domain-containing protein [Sphaerisporangium perillae]|uniref:cellulose binding domain-containing protein n=1 Tax=Sphaerisporangium perillae TaxID=2935860 RepID=UPI00200EAA4D|nr:cellulose binding domain-containing protein [Sphaerisporangium perillae]
MAVVTAIGTAVIGVKLSSGELSLTEAPDCPTGQVCAAIAPGKPSTQGDAPGPTEEVPDATAPSDGESGTPSTSEQAEPSSSASRTPGRRTPAPSSRPTPRRTRTTPTPEPSRSPSDTPEPTLTDEDTEITTPEASPEADQADPVVAPGRVAVDFGVSEVTGTGYTGRLTITNTGSALDGWSVRVPVGGDVTDVTGAEWTQEGDVLALTSTGTLAEGEQAVISFTADGDSAVPETCELNGGRCRLQADGALSSQVDPGQ